MVWHFDNSSFNLHYQLSWLTKISQSYATNQNIWNISTILTRIMNGLCFIIAQMHLRPPLFIWKIKFVLKITKAWGNYYFLYWLPNWTTNFLQSGLLSELSDPRIGQQPYCDREFLPEFIDSLLDQKMVSEWEGLIRNKVHPVQWTNFLHALWSSYQGSYQELFDSVIDQQTSNDQSSVTHRLTNKPLAIRAVIRTHSLQLEKLDVTKVKDYNPLFSLSCRDKLWVR